MTAPQIATEHFTRELAGHTSSDSQSDTVVILHDACYGHRYSRLKSTKTTLSMIVERPERIHASILGASAAYVRLGGHHAGSKNAPHPSRLDVAKPPFRIRRSGRAVDITSSCVTNVHGIGWMDELKQMCQSAAEKLATGAKELARPSLPGEPEKTKLHEGDLYLAAESLDAFQGALGGVADAVDDVFNVATPTKRAFVAVRPPGHHCSADYPSGFCWLNNIHVGIEYAAQTYGLSHAAILDFDLHHGDGSQAIAWERNSKNEQKRLMPKQFNKSKLGPDIGYYSIHDINSYPCEAGDDDKVQAASLCIENAHGQSIWNVHLQPWKSEAEFWKLYEERYQVLLEKAKNFLCHHTARLLADGKTQAQSAIFISAGFDASEWEGEGMQRHKVNVPTEFYARFTEDVVQLAQDPATGCAGRVISVLEGGYSDRALCSGVLSHLSGLCTQPITPSTKGVGSILGLSEHLNSLSIQGSGDGSSLYDKSWWSATNLAALEIQVNPPPPPASGKKARAGPQPTYATPTESFAYKVIDPNKFARSISGTMREAPVPVRPPTPPAPVVNWIVATQELSKLLIPTHRQTKSCTPEELAGTRTKKDRQSAGPVLSTEERAAPRQLRGRKVKGANHAGIIHSDGVEPLRSVNGSNRRETISVLPRADEPAPTARRNSRRLSAGSVLSLASIDIDTEAPPVPLLPSKATSPPVEGSMPPPAAPGTGGVQVKKTRLPAQPRKVPSQSTTGFNQPASRKPSVPLSGSTSAGTSSVTTSTPDMDSLTSGLKKVTLKVSGTKEEHDRKQKDKLDAERRNRALKAAETRRVNAAAKKAAKDSAAPLPPVKREPVVDKIQTETAPSSSNPTVKSELVAPIADVSNQYPASSVQHVAGSVPSVALENATQDLPPAVAPVSTSCQAAAPSDFAGLPTTAQNNGDGPIYPDHLPYTAQSNYHNGLVEPDPQSYVGYPSYAQQANISGLSNEPGQQDYPQPSFTLPATQPNTQSTQPATQTLPYSYNQAQTHVGAVDLSHSSEAFHQPLWSNMTQHPIYAGYGPTAELNNNAVHVGTQSSPPRPSSGRMLPVWSSTGPIPFATSDGMTMTSANQPQINYWGQHQIVSAQDGLVRPNSAAAELPSTLPAYETAHMPPGTIEREEEKSQITNQ